MESEIEDEVFQLRDRSGIHNIRGADAPNHRSKSSNTKLLDARPEEAENGSMEPYARETHVLSNTGPEREDEPLRVKDGTGTEQRKLTEELGHNAGSGWLGGGVTGECCSKRAAGGTYAPRRTRSLGYPETIGCRHTLD
jgi:hypothetical protein